MNPLETYLHDLTEIRGQGIPETTFFHRSRCTARRLHLHSIDAKQACP